MCGGQKVSIDFNFCVKSPKGKTPFGVLVWLVLVGLAQKDASSKKAVEVMAMSPHSLSVSSFQFVHTGERGNHTAGWRTPKDLASYPAALALAMLTHRVRDSRVAMAAMW